MHAILQTYESTFCSELWCENEKPWIISKMVSGGLTENEQSLTVLILEKK